MKKLTLGLVGFFGWGNFGDELFIEVFKQYLSPEFDLFVLNDLTYKPYFTKPVEEVVAKVDAIVIGGGDLLIPWSMSGLYWKKEYLEKPVFVVGIGVPTWGGDPKAHIIEKYTSFLSNKNVKYINVRDKESAEWIKKWIPNSNVSPTYGTDIVFSLKMPTKVKADNKYLGLVTRERRGKADDLSQVMRLTDKAISSGYKIKHIILGTGEVGSRDLERSNDACIEGKELVYSDSIIELCKEISSCQILASMKFHGSVVALTYGIPSIVLSPTDKSRNLMRLIERAELLSSLNDQLLPDRLHPFVPPIPWASIAMLKRRAKNTMQELLSHIKSHIS